MLNSRLIDFISIVFIFYCSLLGLSAEEQKIEWGASKSASYYKLELRDYSTKKIELNKTLTETSYNINKLSPGIYEYRISILNKAKQIVVSSEWTSLSIMQSLEPEGSVNEIYYGGQTDKFQEIFITGSNFYEDTKVEVSSDLGKIPITNLVRISDTELKFVLENAKAKPGTYDLKLINPLNKTFVKKNFYILGKTRGEVEKKLAEKYRVSQGVNPKVDRKYFIRSIFIPGWGQYKSGVDQESMLRKIKGGVFFSATIGTSVFLAASYQSYLKQRRKVGELNDLNNIANYPYNPPFSLTGLYLNQQFNSEISHLGIKWRNFSNASYALVGIYLLNLIDAYFFTNPIQPINQSILRENKTSLKAYISPEHNELGKIGTSYSIQFQFRF